MRLRQIVPTKFANGYRESIDNGKTWTPMFTTWWMWKGKCFRIKRTII
jgi:hypothetical protein